jgi:hypothetical protein
VHDKPPTRRALRADLPTRRRYELFVATFSGSIALS